MPAAVERRHTGSAVTRVAKELLHRSTGHEYPAPFIPFGVGVAARNLLSERSGWKPKARIQRAVVTGLALGGVAVGLVAAGIIASPLLAAGAIGAAAAIGVETFAPEIFGAAVGGAAAVPYYVVSGLDRVGEGLVNWGLDHTIRRGRDKTSAE